MVVVRVERWQGRIIAVWMMIRKEAIGEEVERLADLSDGQTMLCDAGDAHIGVVEPGDEESIGIFGWGTGNREGRYLVEILKMNRLAVAGTLFQKKEIHTITYRSGRHNTELDLLVVRQQQLMKVKDWKVCHHTAQTGRIRGPHEEVVEVQG